MSGTDGFLVPYEGRIVTERSSSGLRRGRAGRRGALPAVRLDDTNAGVMAIAVARAGRRH